MTQTLTISQWLQVAIDHQQHGRLEPAEHIYRGILANRPDNPDALHLLGVLLGQKGLHDEAVDFITRAITARPDIAAYHANLAQAYVSLDRRGQALAELHQAIALDPKYFPAHYALGILLDSLDRTQEAIAAYQTALKIHPGDAQTRNNLAITLRSAGRWDEAFIELEEANRLMPNSANVHTNIAMLLVDTAQHEQAIAAYDRTLELEPPTPQRLSARTAVLQYDSRFGAEDFLAQARRFDELFARPLAQSILPHSNSRDPNRKIRVGYVSPDLRNHVVGRCMLSILANHDREQFQIHCYANVANEDDVSEQIRRRADKWLNILRLDDQSVAQAIREDQIDLLVDLAVHTRGNRLPVFALKPAPVQITWLGCCTTTGLSTIDYRISDAYSDPPETDLTQYAEQTLRLPDVHLCYQPLPEAPDVSPLPADANGFITFGSMNNFTKVSTAAIDAWIQILRAVPNSRLILHTQPSKHLDPLYRRFESAGVSRDRLDIVPHGSNADFFSPFSRIDIALDPFPYNGAITTCDSLWMGIPVVTLSGQTAVGRMGRCILSNIGHPELIADSVEQYVRLAVDWAQDLNRLARIRSELRGKLQNSPLMNPAQLTRNLEHDFRQVWQNYCNNTTSPGGA